MFNAFVEAFSYELKSIKNSWYKLFLISILPLLSFVLIVAIFSSGVVQNIPIAVVDNDKSKLSRSILFNIEASPTTAITFMSNSTNKAISLVNSSQAYAAIVIPKNFEKDTLLQKQPHITAMLNTQYILIGKILTSALSSTIMTSSAQVEYIKNLVEIQNPSATMNSISPIGLQITPFFNMYQNYFYFLVSALLPAIWQIFIVVATLVSVGVIFKEKREKEVFKNTKHISSKLIGLMLPYTMAFMLLGVIYLFYLYSRWEFQGSMSVLIFAMFLTVVAYQLIALLFFVTGFDYARSLSLGAVYTAPAFAFLGVTFPIYNMNGFALFWRDLLPVSHYMELQISQANYGADIFLETDKLWILLSFWLVVIPVVLLFKKRLKKELEAKDIS
jgi:ABC-2 type transport system permease protein